MSELKFCRREDLPDNVLTVSRSRLGVWNTCQFKHDLMYNRGLERQGNSTPQLLLGTAVHNHLQVYYNYWIGKPVGFLSGAEIQELFAPLYKKNYELQLYNLRAATLVMRYSDYSAVNDPFIALETELEIFCDLEIKTADGRPIYLHGIIDLLFDMDGMVGFLDHKTSSVGGWDYEMAYFDNQLAFYNILFKLNDITMDVAFINNINTYNYVSLAKQKDEKLFSRVPVYPEKMKFDAYIKNLKAMIRQIVNLKYPVKNLDRHCRYCPFRLICDTEQRNVDSSAQIDMMSLPDSVATTDELLDL